MSTLYLFTDYSASVYTVNEQKPKPLAPNIRYTQHTLLYLNTEHGL